MPKKTQKKEIKILWYDLHNRKPTKGAIRAVQKRFPKRKQVFIVTNNFKKVLDGNYDILSTQEIPRFSKLDNIIRDKMHQINRYRKTGKAYTLDCLSLPDDIWVVYDY